MLTSIGRGLKHNILSIHPFNVGHLQGNLARPIIASTALSNKLWAEGKPIPITNRTTVVIDRALRGIPYRV